MTNITRTVAATAGFIPQVWAQRALDVLRANMVLARLVTRHNDFEPGWQGQTLTIPFPGSFTAANKAEGATVAVQAPAGGASVSVTLNRHMAVDFLVEDFARAQASAELLDRYVRPAAIAIGNAVEDDLFALHAGLAVGGGTAATGLTAATVRTAMEVLNTAEVPVAPRHLIISSKDHAALLGDTSLTSYFAYARNQALAEGNLGRLFGFDVWMSQRVPVLTGPPVETRNLAFHPEALILATRPFRDPPAATGVQAALVQDPATGLSLRVLYSYDMATRGVRVGLDILYGVALLRAAMGRVIRS